MRKKLVISSLCGCFLLSACSLAWGFDVKPGKWEVTTTVTMPMMPQPRVVTSTDCITEEKARQDPLKDLIRDSNCKVFNRKERGNSLDFEVECTQQAVTTRGKGHYSSRGNTMSGFMEMTMDMPEMGRAPGMPSAPMKMRTSWQGKRIGSCQ